MDVMGLVDEYSRYLQGRGFGFDEHGFPAFRTDMFLQEWPELVVPFKHRADSFVARPERTALCFYCADELIYPRLEKVLGELSVYRGFLAVIGSDVTVTDDMDFEWQGEIMLLNQLFTAVLAANGIKVVANIRSGGERSEEYLSCIPKGVACASGFLGCRTASSRCDFRYVSKVLGVRPSKLLLYGRRDRIVEEQLTTLGVPWRAYPHVRGMCFGDAS